MVVDESRHAAYAVFSRDVFNRLHHEPDEAVALRSNPAHDGGAVDTRRVGLHAESRCFAYRMRRLGRCDQQLARHAANAGAGRPVRPTLDERHVIRPLASGTVGGEAGRTGADDGDIHTTLFHDKSSSLRGAA